MVLLPGDPHLALRVDSGGQVAAVDDEAEGGGPGARQLVCECSRAIAIAEEEGGADGAHAPHDYVATGEPVPAQHLQKELVLLGPGQRRAPVRPTEIWL